MTRTAKRAFKFRCYPTDAQAVELARTFGGVRELIAVDRWYPIVQVVLGLRHADRQDARLTKGIAVLEGRRRTPNGQS